jgi:hypothetical protein
MKISDAGPTPQRIDPHILTAVRHALVLKGDILQINKTATPWFHLANADPQLVQQRLEMLESLHRQTAHGSVPSLLGQTLEIAVFRALSSQSLLHYLGHFHDLHAHDDSLQYSKEEPPTWLSGRRIPGKKKLDFLIHHPACGFGGVEVKNIRPWIYPGHPAIQEMLLKCGSLDVVPILIARRIHFSTFRVLNPCGVLLHETFNQLYPASCQALATQVRDKRLLGYHDVRVGNQPDARLLRFIQVNLPQVLPAARKSFDLFKDLLLKYATDEISFESFVYRVKRRVRGEPEDSPDDEQGILAPGDFDVPDL